MDRRPNGILKVLQDCGYDAYYVGGCVRDILLGRPVHDWDIATSARPDQIMACFENSVPSGGVHGTVTVVRDGFEAEITTYRKESDYADGRHPQNVTFVSELSDDLVRRDFTVNAMAMDKEGNITDLYNGQEDIKNKIIRCVGEPERRFREDALRMFRAVRFAAQLGFGIEEETVKAIELCAPLCAQLSSERIRDEVEKILCSQAPEQLDTMARLGMLTRFSPSTTHSCRWLSHLPKEPVIRWAGLCRTWPQMDLTQMRLSKKVTAEAIWAGTAQAPETLPDWKQFIAQNGAERSHIVAALEGKETVVEEILSSGQCLSLRDLAVCGKDLHVSGPEVGEILQKLLQHVLAHPEDNKKEILLKLI